MLAFISGPYEVWMAATVIARLLMGATYHVWISKF
jgi:hypothetical protein